MAPSIMKIVLVLTLNKNNNKLYILYKRLFALTSSFKMVHDIHF